jgi:hypothetical protein
MVDFLLNEHLFSIKHRANSFNREEANVADQTPNTLKGVCQWV